MKTVYNAKAPDIPGCYTQGENVEQAMSVARRSELLINSESMELSNEFYINLLKYPKVDNYLYNRHNLAIRYMIKSSNSALLAVYRCFSSFFFGDQFLA
jgi:hypothetical protein